jgi:predicted nucleotidyltransferase
MSLDARTLATVVAILASHLPDARVVAFGSRVRGGAWQGSDLDLAIFPAAPLSSREWRHVEEAFEDSELPFRVDVIDAARLPESMRAAVLAEGLVLQDPGQP